MVPTVDDRRRFHSTESGSRSRSDHPGCPLHLVFCPYDDQTITGTECYVGAGIDHHLVPPTFHSENQRSAVLTDSRLLDGFAGNIAIGGYVHLFDSKFDRAAGYHHVEYLRQLGLHCHQRQPLRSYRLRCDDCIGAGEKQFSL